MRQELRTNIQENSGERQTDNKEDQITLPYNTELLSILKDAVIISDENFKIIYWNHATEEIYGWKLSEVIAIHLHELIDELLAYSRINTQPNEFTCVDIGDVLNTVENNLDILINEKDVVITSEELPTINADKIQIIELFQNLINNSIKYSGKQKPKIHIFVMKKYDKWIFDVEDNGIGIPHEYSDKIFKIFQRIHDSKEYNGTGIGLAISKRIVEKHGGTMGGY